MRNIKEFYKNNKTIIYILLLVLILICLIYCSKNTFIINDDLPYSFFHRTSMRITNTNQIIDNQKSDYRNISPRVFVHYIVQFLLIYGKNIWSILNPIFITLTMFIMNKISELYTKKKNNILSILIIITTFLSMITYKKIIYWVAGSVNYVWTGLYLLLIIYIYLKRGYSKNKILNMIIILTISILHEYLLVFSIVFVLITYIINAYKQKKIITTEIFYFVPLIISARFLLNAPSITIRTGSNEIWNSLNIIQKLQISLPIISKNFILNDNYNNYIAIFYIIILSIAILKNNLKYKKIIFAVNILLTILAIGFDCGWLYFILAIVLFIITIYYLIITKKSNLVPVFISMYAIVFSMCITPEYDNYRSSYIVYLFLIVLTIIIILEIIKNNNLKIITLIFIILCSVFVINEIYSYTIIGLIHKERIDSIEMCKQNNCQTLYLKEIPARYEFYHMDINSPNSSNYFAFNSFVNYYNLNKNIEINYYK